MKQVTVFSEFLEQYQLVVDYCKWLENARKAGYEPSEESKESHPSIAKLREFGFIDLLLEGQ